MIKCGQLSVWSLIHGCKNGKQNENSLYALVNSY